jgi:hypothetical protein
VERVAGLEVRPAVEEQPRHRRGGRKVERRRAVGPDRAHPRPILVEEGADPRLVAQTRGGEDVDHRAARDQVRRHLRIAERDVERGPPVLRLVGRRAARVDVGPVLQEQVGDLAVPAVRRDDEPRHAALPEGAGALGAREPGLIQ